MSMRKISEEKGEENEENIDERSVKIQVAEKEEKHSENGNVQSAPKVDRYINVQGEPIQVAIVQGNERLDDNRRKEEHADQDVDQESEDFEDSVVYAN